MSIIDEIYDGLTDDEAFEALPDRLARAVDARSCMLQAFGLSGDLLFAAHNGYFSTESLTFYAENEMFRYDPWREQINRQSRWNTAFSSGDLMNSTAYERSILYNEVFRRFGDDTAHCLGAGMRHGAGWVELGIHRGLRAETFSDSEVAVIQPLVPHLRRLLTVRTRLHEAGLRQVLAEQVLDGLPQAILVVDAAGRLLFANRPGEELLTCGGQLTQRSGRVRALDHGCDAQLHNLIVQAGRGAGSHGGAFRMAAADGSQRRVVIIPWRGARASRAIILIEDPNAQDTSLAAKLAGLYGLTVAEAETVAALAQGMSTAEAAEARGVSMATLRTQIHHALRKSDARTLAELVRLAASLPRIDRRS